MIEDLFLNIKTSLRMRYTKFERSYQELYKHISRPDASVGRLDTTLAHPELIEWLRARPSYQSWWQDDKSSILSITGPSGSGKTYLSSHILNTLLVDNSSSESIFLSFGLYKWDSRRNSKRCLIASLINQMLATKPSLYRRVHSVAELLARQPSISCAHLWRFFSYLLATIRNSRVFIILNAVDQCLSSATINQIALLTTATTIPGALKIIMTSSESLQLPSGVVSEILPLDNQEWKDFVHYRVVTRVSQIIDKRPVWKDWRDDIVNKLCIGNYTYFYAMLNLDFLENANIPSTRSALKQHLMTPVLSIDKVFQTMLDHLSESKHAILALNWIFYAIRPLTIAELAVALTLTVDLTIDLEKKRETFDVLAESVSWDLMRDLGELMNSTVKVHNGQISLTHHSFRSYLETNSKLLIPDFHAKITKHCLSYLSLCAESTTLNWSKNYSVKKNPVNVALALLDYAETYWVDHYKHSQAANISLDEEVQNFLTTIPKLNEPIIPLGESEINQTPEILKAHTKPQPLTSWIQKYGLAFGWEGDIVKEYSEPIILATQLGFERILQNIIRMPRDSERVKEAIPIAARTGNLRVLRLLLGLLSKSISSDVVMCAIYFATQYGHVDVIEVLMSYLSDSDKQLLKLGQGVVKSPLLPAASNGHTAVVQALLSEEFSLDVSDDSDNTVVHLASLMGDIETLQVIEASRKDWFLDAMALMNSDQMSPLQLTCKAGSIEAFDLVYSTSPSEIKWGTGRNSKNPIQLAAKFGHVEIVEKLILGMPKEIVRDHGADALIVAAQNGHHDVVHCLLKELDNAMAPPGPIELQETTATDIAQGNQLRWVHDLGLEDSLLDAIRNGHSKVVKLLIERTDRSLGKDKDYIETAVETGYLDVVKVLVAAGIPVKCGDDEYNGLMDIAIREDRADVVRYLMEEGVGAQWDDWETSIHYAVRCGFNYCLTELLRKATISDVQRKSSEGFTALELAVEYGEFEALERLWPFEKMHGATERPRPLRILLSAIHSNQPGKENIIRFLLDNTDEWDANPADDDQEIPIHVAAKQGDEKVVKLLLDKRCG
ncbi:ankyrin repeat-containing domain protein [Biscogniauxia sp. FL1348]|nr:ankyrin repeat-containing domain protein [Biscogniauxia sp. FL1348]